MAAEKVPDMFVQVHELDMRSADVQSEFKCFEDLMIDPRICQMLNRFQKFRPTPVQAKALPLLMFGTDALVQAKAGTGKTLVFAILASKVLHETAARERIPKVLVVSPSREIAQQNCAAIKQLMPYGCRATLCVGQTNVKANQQALREGCQVAVGTCGRLVQLHHVGQLKLEKVELLILDEADQLMEENFERNINDLFNALQPVMKQVIVFSATFPYQLESMLKRYMKEPELIRLDCGGEQLIAMREYAVLCDRLNKAESLQKMLDYLVFNQCMVFCDTIHFAQDVFEFLSVNEIDCEIFSSNLDQEERFDVVKRFRDKKTRILVSTDLAGRGLDFPGVDLVINVCVAYDSHTHMHRQGRAGRYGGVGVAITLLLNEKEAQRLVKYQADKKLTIKILDIENSFPYNLVENVAFYESAMHLKDHALIKGIMRKIGIATDSDATQQPVKPQPAAVIAAAVTPPPVKPRPVAAIAADMTPPPVKPKPAAATDTDATQQPATSQPTTSIATDVTPQPATSAAAAFDLEARTRQRREETEQRRAVLAERAQQSQPPAAHIAVANASDLPTPATAHVTTAARYPPIYTSGIIDYTKPADSSRKSLPPIEAWTTYEEFCCQHSTACSIVESQIANAPEAPRIGARMRARHSVAEHRERMIELSALVSKALQ